MFAFAASAFTQTNPPSSISVRFSDRIYEEPHPINGNTTKRGLRIMGSMASRYDSSLDPWYGSGVPRGYGNNQFSIGGAFGAVTGYQGITTSAFYQATVKEGSIYPPDSGSSYLGAYSTFPFTQIIDFLHGDALSFEILLTSETKGQFQPRTNVSWLPDDSYGASAGVSCEFMIISESPFTYESNRPLNFSSGGNTQGIPEDAYYSQTYAAGTYYVDLSVSSMEYGPETNSVNAWFILRKANVGAPRIASFNKTPQQFLMNWNDQWDRAVRIQRSSALTSTSWETIGYGAVGQKSFVDTNAPTGSAFYRLVW